jgi:mannose-6-phosphate isomerase-like protein (cupin superfamily)
MTVPASVHAYEPLLRRRAEGGRPYLEFLRAETMSAGLYVLPAGGHDGQSPHQQDEVYVVVRGLACVTIGDDTHEVGAGTTIYVPAGVPHRFHDIADDLHVLVVFAPPETE